MNARIFDGRQDGPLSPSSVDIEVQALGGGNTTAMQFREPLPKAPAPSPKDRIKELEDEIAQLDRDIAYFSSLKSILLDELPEIQDLVEQLYRIVSTYSELTRDAIETQDAQLRQRQK